MNRWKFVDTALLRVGYQEWNPSGQRTMVLMHGWPDSPRCWNPMVPALVSAGFRVIAPALRGFSPTTFLRPETPRTGQLAALGRDLIEFLHALAIDRPVLVGHDWGARAVANACGLQPGIASHLVMIAVGYGTNHPSQPLTLEQAHNYWYHWYMATPRGAQTVRESGREFARKMWDLWAPTGWYTAEEFDITADAFDNPDWADVVLHSYCHRWGHAPGDPAYEADDRALNPSPVLSVPTLVLHGAVDTVNVPAGSANKEHFFTGPYQRLLLEGVGHFPQREASQAVTKALLDFVHSHS